MITRCK